jgi:hypothetical protein
MAHMRGDSTESGTKSMLWAVTSLGMLRLVTFDQAPQEAP